MNDRSGVMTHAEENESTRAILENVLQDVTNILRAEVRLARAEVKDDLGAARDAAGLFGAAALCGALCAASLTACLIAGLSLIMPVWLAAVLAAVILVCMGGAFYAGGRSRLSRAKAPLEKTREQVRITNG